MESAREHTEKATQASAESAVGGSALGVRAWHVSSDEALDLFCLLVSPRLLLLLLLLLMRLVCSAPSSQCVECIHAPR
jgi:hypothetical protein